jgi:N-acylneuraminate cytidylyltransferase
MGSLAIIPARAGSKRIPKKNIREFKGKPMIAWSIETALASKLFDEVVVSTDDSVTAKIARDYGATTPFIRPKNLADDHATTAEVMAHAADWVADHFDSCEYLCCIYATAPFLHADDLREGLFQLTTSHVGYTYAVSEFDYSPYRALSKSEDGLYSLQQQTFAATRSQDLPKLYHDAGQFYWSTVKQCQLNLNILSCSGIGIPISRMRSQDIDTEEDWRMAELIFESAKANLTSTIPLG